MDARTNNDVLQDTQRKTKEVERVIRQNMQLAIDRGEQLENIDKKADDLLNRSRDLAKGADQVKHLMCRRSVCMILVIVLVVLVFLESLPFPCGLEHQFTVYSSRRFSYFHFKVQLCQLLNNRIHIQMALPTSTASLVTIGQTRP